MFDSLPSTPTMESAVNQSSRLSPYLSVYSTANQRLPRLIPTQTLTMPLLRRQQLQPLPPRVAILLVVVLGLAVPLAALVTAAHLTEVRGALLGPPGARGMHPLFVSGLIAGIFFLLIEIDRLLTQAACSVYLG